ncbi:hypothetical protein [Kitasatospora sp. GP82]|uniref:hypothetical protein n=1 Tax=Kitasatospora sp. GP82 TaxID=3035089 RepID=UPI0024759640|nr:hypothetical protein [Kitasatospora sp. GP82]
MRAHRTSGRTVHHASGSCRPPERGPPPSTGWQLHRLDVLLVALGSAQSLVTTAGATAAGLAAHRALRGRLPADGRNAATAVAAIGTAVLLQETLDAALEGLRWRIRDRHGPQFATLPPAPAPAAEGAAAPAQLTPMQEVEAAAASAAAYEAQLHSWNILGNSGPLWERRGWTGATDGTATHDLPFGAVLHYRPNQLLVDPRTGEQLEGRFVLAAGGEEAVVTTGAELFAYVQRLADGKTLFDLTLVPATEPGCWPLEDHAPAAPAPDTDEPTVSKRPPRRPSRTVIGE